MVEFDATAVLVIGAASVVTIGFIYYALTKDKKKGHRQEAKHDAHVGRPQADSNPDTKPQS